MSILPYGWDDNRNHKVTTSQMKDACIQMMNCIDKKGLDNVSRETKNAYVTMRKFVIDTEGEYNFATIYYP